MLVGDPLDESGRSCLRNNQPPLRPGPILDGVQEDGLAGASRPGVQRRPACSSRPVLDGLYELGDEVIATCEQRRADTEARVERVWQAPMLPGLYILLEFLEFIRLETSMVMKVQTLIQDELSASP
jgi:hypothetical protein